MGPFYDPTFGIQSIPALDIFGLGSLFYTILTGRWPYRSSPGPSEAVDEKTDYEMEVHKHFSQGEFPDVTRLVGGGVIMGCWTKKYATAEEVLHALDTEMPIIVLA
jgi:hypothetical protein